MFGRKAQNTKTNKNMQSGRRDTVTISSEAQELSMKKSISGRTRNTSVDSTIDLQKYIDDARESNRAALENAGSEIDVNAVTYTDNSQAFRAALTDKYSKLAAEAKTHSNPEEYIYGKYYDKGSQYYETNLTETERRIAYNYIPENPLFPGFRYVPMKFHLCHCFCLCLKGSDIVIIPAGKDAGKEKMEGLHFYRLQDTMFVNIVKRELYWQESWSAEMDLQRSNIRFRKG